MDDTQSLSSNLTDTLDALDLKCQEFESARDDIMKCRLNLASLRVAKGPHPLEDTETRLFGRSLASMDGHALHQLVSKLEPSLLGGRSEDVCRQALRVLYKLVEERKVSVQEDMAIADYHQKLELQQQQRQQQSTVPHTQAQAQAQQPRTKVPQPRDPFQRQAGPAEQPWSGHGAHRKNVYVLVAYSHRAGPVRGKSYVFSGYNRLQIVRECMAPAAPYGYGSVWARKLVSSAAAAPSPVQVLRYIDGTQAGEETAVRLWEFVHDAANHF